MAELQFEWDENKNNINIKKHGVSFEYAIRVFRDPFRLDLYDEENSGINPYGVWEDRYIAIGYVNDILYVVYTIRAENDNEVVRIISARQAEASEIREYIQVRPGGENL